MPIYFDNDEWHIGTDPNAAPVPKGDTDMLQAAWIEGEAKRIRNQRRHELIYSIVFYGVCIVVVCVFAVVVLGLVR